MRELKALRGGGGGGGGGEGSRGGRSGGGSSGGGRALADGSVVAAADELESREIELWEQARVWACVCVCVCVLAYTLLFFVCVAFSVLECRVFCVQSGGGQKRWFGVPAGVLSGAGKKYCSPPSCFTPSLFVRLTTGWFLYINKLRG